MRRLSPFWEYIYGFADINLYFGSVTILRRRIWPLELQWSYPGIAGYGTPKVRIGLCRVRENTPKTKIDGPLLSGVRAMRHGWIRMARLDPLKCIRLRMMQTLTLRKPGLCRVEALPWMASVLGSLLRSGFVLVPRLLLCRPRGCQRARSASVKPLKVNPGETTQETRASSFPGMVRCQMPAGTIA